jgi:hypothetical protein
MQIARTQPYASLPVPHEATRERAADTTALLVQPQGAESRRATRAVDEIRSAERTLVRQRAQERQVAWMSAGRQQRAVAAYQSLQRSDERAYVSEVLGIDVYA